MCKVYRFSFFPIIFFGISPTKRITAPRLACTHIATCACIYAYIPYKNEHPPAYVTKRIQNGPFPSDLVVEGGVDDAGADYASVPAVCAQVLCEASF